MLKQAVFFPLVCKVNEKIAIKSPYDLNNRAKQQKTSIRFLEPEQACFRNIEARNASSSEVSPAKMYPLRKQSEIGGRLDIGWKLKRNSGLDHSTSHESSRKESISEQKPLMTYPAQIKQSFLNNVGTLTNVMAQGLNYLQSLASVTN